MNFPVVYAVKHKDLDVRMSSRSGGIFTAISDRILSENGVVYGCILTESFEAVHVRAETAEDRNRMRGSKYIQSNMGDMFQQVQEDLHARRYVLFTGTSCQIAGLKAFLGKHDTDRLFCVDIVCHGVPSLRVWKSYLAWQEEVHHGKVVSVDFRNKKDFGWAAHIETLDVRKGQNQVEHISSDVFKTLFYGHWILRPSCYQCPYKSTVHPGDITIADYWGIDTAAPGFNDNKGVSLVLVNSKAGNEMFETVSEQLEYRSCRIENSMQPPLKAPFAAPADRAQFWLDMDSKPFSYIAKHYGTIPFSQKLRRKLKRILKSHGK